MGKLTALSVRAAKLPGSYQDGQGLMLLVKPSGSRSWLLRLQSGGKRRDFGLGSARHVSLAEARAKAEGVRALVKSGIDPVAQRQAAQLAQRTIPTFRDAALKVHGELLGSWRNARHGIDWLTSLERAAFGALGDVRVDLIDAPIVRQMILPIWLDTPETARRVLQRVRTVMDWATEQQFRTGVDIKGLAKGLPRQPKTATNFAAMAYTQVPAFCASLLAEPESLSRLALLFIIYTAARSGEVRGMRWNEVDLEAKLWTIPADRMKAERVHIVPLNEPALAILTQLAKTRLNMRPEALVFPGKAGQPLNSTTLTKVLRERKLGVTVHGFRSSFKDWASECTRFPDAVSEAALAHGDPDKTRAAYRRTVFMEMRTQMMAQWAAYLETKPSR